MGHVEGPFRLHDVFPALHPRVAALLVGGLERISGLRRIERMYRELPPALDLMSFLHRSLARLAIEYQVPKEERAHIPLQGGTVVVANHPFGAIEGVIAAHLLRGLRSDVKILANTMLERVPEVSELFIGVDVFGGDGAVRRNGRALKEALHWLKQGGLLLVFPAGVVSHLDLRAGRVSDSQWSPMIGRMVRRSGATAVPLYFAGRNSALFQIAGLLHPLVRTALLPRELLNKMGSTLRLRIGAPIPYARLQRLEDDAELTAQLRLRTYMLQDLHRSQQSALTALGEFGGTEAMQEGHQIGTLR